MYGEQKGYKTIYLIILYFMNENFLICFHFKCLFSVRKSVSLKWIYPFSFWSEAGSPHRSVLFSRSLYSTYNT